MVIAHVIVYEAYAEHGTISTKSILNYNCYITIPITFNCEKKNRLFYTIPCNRIRIHLYRDEYHY